MSGDAAIDVGGLLGADGPVARALGPSYEPRAEQVSMAAAVAEAMASRTHLVAEAGTGVGKSFAYLAPAVARAALTGDVTVVATNTIALQEQLVQKDGPLMLGALAEVPGIDDVRAVLVKGRGNYLSLRRLKMASERAEKLLPDAASRRSLRVIEDWAYETRDGTLSTLPPLERAGVWDKAQSDAGNCMGRKCPTYSKCFYQQARLSMEGARLLITNHALFFSDLALRARTGGDHGILPRYQHVVLDEAHMVEDVAAENFGVSLTEWRVNHLLSSLYQQKTGKGFLSHLELFSGDMGPIDRVARLVMSCERASRGFFEEIVRLSRSEAVSNGRVRVADAVENPLTGAFNELALALRNLKDAAKSEPDRFELNAYAIRASEIADSAEAWVSQTAEGCCYWIEAGGEKGRSRVRIAASPIDVGPLLREHLFDRPFSVTMTSATLATRRVGSDELPERAEAAFGHFLERVGAEGARTMQVGSPFDYAEQLKFFVDVGMPAPGRGDANEQFVRELVARVLEQAGETGGGVFVLFTSFYLLERTAAALWEPLEALGMPLFVQGRGPGGGSKAALLEGFRESGNGVLLGAASFWQGVDVRGEALRNVIITRLPFEPPDRPLTEARLERIRERGGDPFREDSLPRAVIRFKQGVGRLIRSGTDRGRVVVLDPRLVQKSYGGAFLRALPAGVVVEEIGGGAEPF